MTERTPEGYLGADARITSGPAPELLAAGYGLEIADAPLLHDGLTQADLAHVLALTEQGLIPAEVAGPLLAALLELGEVPADEFPYDARLGDAYNSRERELSRRVGDLAGWVHLGRTRREAGRIAFRLALRDRLVDLAEAVTGSGDALVALAGLHAETVWADTTYLQPAQASTFGHYLASFAEESARHLERLRAAYALVDVSPAGSGGVGGTRLGLDRDRLAALLGFGTVGANTRDTMWNVDWLADVVTVAAQAALTADRLAEDLEIFASPGFGYVELDASLCRASVLMPQKRNPYALAVIRSGASTLLGRATGVLATGRTPSARTDNWLHAYGEVVGAVELATRLVALGAAVVRTLVVDATALARSATDQQIAMTDLADEIVRRAGLDYRTAYRITGRAIAHSLAEGVPVSAAGLDEAATAVAGSPLSFAEVELDEVLDPARQVGSRTEPGGSGPAQVRAELAVLAERIVERRDWVANRRAAHEQARTSLVDLARERAGG